MQKDFKIWASIKHLLVKYQIFSKLPQTSHIHKNLFYSSFEKGRPTASNL